MRNTLTNESLLDSTIHPLSAQAAATVTAPVHSSDETSQIDNEQDEVEDEFDEEEFDDEDEPELTLQEQNDRLKDQLRLKSFYIKQLEDRIKGLEMKNLPSTCGNCGLAISQVSPLHKMVEISTHNTGPTRIGAATPYSCSLVPYRLDNSPAYHTPMYAIHADSAYNVTSNVARLSRSLNSDKRV